MQKDSFDFLVRLLETPSPSGFEEQVQAIIKKRVQRFADTVEVDIHGNLIAAINPDAPIRVMLAGHCDQIGLMVTFIDESGYLYFNQIGGIDPAVLPGSLVTVHSRQGPLTGVIGSKPVHLTPPPERGKSVELSKLWIDLGMKDGKEVKEIVEIGDPVTYQLGVTRMGENRIASPGCDDKSGAFVVMEALRLVSQAKRKNSPVALFAVSTVQEEIGLRGSRTSCFGIDPLVGIAVDVTHASDNPGAEAKTVGSVKLGEGPTIARGANFNRALVEHMTASAKKAKIPYQPHCAPGATGTDANSIQISRAGVATGLVGIPNRYMHTQVEIVDLRDLTASAQLLAETVLGITQRMDFIPS